MVEYIFSYGTLRDESVQLSVFGRRLKGESDQLTGYRVVEIEIQDPDYVAFTGSTKYGNLHFTKAGTDQVEGIVFELESGDLALSDAYEPAPYHRTLVELASGKQAWVYWVMDRPGK